MAHSSVSNAHVYPKISWDQHLPTLPKDADGYVESFEILLSCDDEKQKQENKAQIQQFFNTYGVVVIRDILDEKEAELSCSELFDFVEQNVQGVDRNDPNTWHKIGGLSASLGMITDFPVMSPQLCKNRINEKLYTAYSYILDTDVHNLYSNIGRVGWMRPTRNIRFGEEKTEDRKAWKTKAGSLWLHQDFDPISNHCTTFGLMPVDKIKSAERDPFLHVRTQGILALDDCSDDDGGFQCIPGFHAIMDTVWKQQYGVEFIKKGTFQHRYQFKSNDPLLAHVTRCPLKSGSLLVWNSKLPHNNFSNNSSHGRKVQYIKYARYDDPAVRPVRFGVEQRGAWGGWPLNLEFPFDKIELNDVTKRLYGIDQPETAVSETKADDKKTGFKCIVL